MSPEFWTIIAVGVAVLGIGWRMIDSLGKRFDAWLDSVNARLDALKDGVNSLNGRRTSKDGLPGVSGRRWPVVSHSPLPSSNPT